MPIFNKCSEQLESSPSNLLAEAFGATTLEPVIVKKGKTTNNFILSNRNLYLNENLQWDKLPAAKFFKSKAEAEELALNNDYFIDLKN